MPKLVRPQYTAAPVMIVERKMFSTSDGVSVSSLYGVPSGFVAYGSAWSRFGV